MKYEFATVMEAPQPTVQPPETTVLPGTEWGGMTVLRGDGRDGMSRTIWVWRVAPSDGR